MSVMIHPTAEVSEKALIGDDTKVWHYVQIREGARVGAGCVLSKSVYIDHDVAIGDRVKIQNGVSIYHGVVVEDDVLIAANVAFTNDKFPRAFNKDWIITPTLIKQGASIGANATIVCGIVVGEYAMVGAGSVVTKDVPPYALVVGNPAVVIGKVNKSGERVK
jgi:UDP-2-acetamido-3-amino-2,3-dideoxy-glucuronate N-acetyltransferase